MQERKKKKTTTTNKAKQPKIKEKESNDVNVSYLTFVSLNNRRRYNFRLFGSALGDLHDVFPLRVDLLQQTIVCSLARGTDVTQRPAAWKIDNQNHQHQQQRQQRQLQRLMMLHRHRHHHYVVNSQYTTT